MPSDEHQKSRPTPPPSKELLARVYTELRSVAAVMMAGERKSHTLQPTALVHEAWLRLQRSNSPGPENRAQFFHAAAESMRRILIEHARGKKRLKRGGDRPRLACDMEQLPAWEDPTEILAIDEAIQRLTDHDSRSGEVARLRFFAGLSVTETAEALGLSERSVRREWAYARARLTRMLEAGGQGKS